MGLSFYYVGNAVGLVVGVGTGGVGVSVLGSGVLLGMGEAVKGKAVSVSGRVGGGVTVFPGSGVG